MNFTQRSTLFLRRILYDLESFDLFEVRSNRTPKTIRNFSFPFTSRFARGRGKSADNAQCIFLGWQREAFSSQSSTHSPWVHEGKEFCLERNRSRRKGFDVNSFANTKKGGGKRNKMGRRKNFGTFALFVTYGSQYKVGNFRNRQI